MRVVVSKVNINVSWGVRAGELAAWLPPEDPGAPEGNRGTYELVGDVLKVT